MKINENVALAKAILNKNGILKDSEEYNDYLKIREICGVNTGYIGILTKIRFVDSITDMDELKSIFDILKNSKMDIGKLNKLTYDQILEIFYDELNKTDKDIELIFKDKEYSYYRVYTYEGILKIGSPAWCLKTKTNWDEYQKSYPEQWVVISNEYRNKIMTPNTSYVKNYSSNKGWIRYGISINGNSNFVANDDNNVECKYSISSYTFFGIACTLRNLRRNIKKSYYEEFPGCEKSVFGKFLKVVDIEKFLKACDSFGRENNGSVWFQNIEQSYVMFSSTYSDDPALFMIGSNTHILIPTTGGKIDKCISLGPVAKSLLAEQAKISNDIVFSGFKLELGLLNMKEIEEKRQFIKKVDNWIIFDRNEFYYLIVNTDTTNDLDIPFISFNQGCYTMDNPVWWFLDKETKKPFKISYSLPIIIKDHQKKIIDEINKYEKSNKDKPGIWKKKEDIPEKKVKGFWDFLKKKKE